MTNNKITISRGNVNKNVDPITGKGETAEQVPQVDRSFAQQNPVVAPRVVTPKTKASEAEEKAALDKNSTKKPE